MVYMRVGVVRFVPGEGSDPGHSGWNPIPFFLRHDPEKARRPSGDFRELAANRTAVHVIKGLLLMYYIKDNRTTAQS